MKKTVWTFGLIAGGILSLMMAITIPFHESIGAGKAEVIGYASMVAAFLLTFFGVKQYRDSVGNGSISFGRALAVGALITAVASACYVATWQVIYFGGGPEFQQRFEANMIEGAKRSGRSQADIDARIAQMKKYGELYKNPAVNAAITFIEPLPVGLIIALVSAGVLRRRRNESG